ncbi:MAG: hypothetical protein EU544_01015 [Promethearchaeota archaeon]|nr:MAG: hypothetical protein EU544_01015 [Candidatus Lokiarchaeota archaeon]
MPKPKNKTQYEILQDVKYFDDITSCQIIMAIQKQSGECFEKEYYNQGDGIKENFVSGFLTALSSFETVISEQLGMESEGNQIKAIQYGDFSISIVDGELLRLALISSEPIGNLFRDKCKILVDTYEEKHSYDLEKFRGDMDIFFDFRQEVEKQLDVKLNYKSKINAKSLEKYEGPKSVRKVLETMVKMGDEFYPVNLPPILMREAELTETNAKYYTYDAYLWYVFEQIESPK